MTTGEKWGSASLVPVRAFSVLLGLSAIAAAYGCDGPCRSLAERICNCESYVRERAACIQEIDSNGNVRQPTEAEDDRCVALLDSCSCAALEREDFAACGLTK